jgi:hypothetical protein
MKTTTTTARLAIAIALLAATSRAQNTPPADTTPADDAVLLSSVTIEAADDADSILSLRPSRSLYGFDELLKDTPRSVFQISKAQLATDNIRNFADFSRYSPAIRRGTTTPYGIAGIRGSMGDQARNGVILINTALRPFNSNAWESVDIVAGAPSVSQGSSAKVAGYINYITKKPFFDGPHTTITAQAGRLGKSNDTSYPQYTVTLDHSRVLIPEKLAARISLQRSEAEQYWRGSQADFKDVYAALTWKPTKDLTFESNLSYTRSSGALPWGINRVDQELIDNWTYRAGDYVPLVTYGGNRYKFNQALNNGLGGWFLSNATGNDTNANTLEYTLVNAPWAVFTDNDANGVQDKSAVATLSFTTPVGGLTRQPIKGSQVIAGQRGANNIADQFILQGVTTYRANDWLTIINRTSYQYVKNINRNFDYMFSEHPNRLFETRLEFLTDKEFKLFGKNPVRWQNNTGSTYRYLLNNCDSATSSDYSSELNTWANALNPATLDLSYRLSSYLYQMSADNLINIHPTHVGGLDWTDSTPWVDSSTALKGILKSGYGYFYIEPNWPDGGTYRSLSIGGGSSGGYGLASAYFNTDRRNNYLHYFTLFSEQKFDITQYLTLRLDGRYSYIYDTIKMTKLTLRLLNEGYFAGSPYENVPTSSHAENHQWQYGGSLSLHPFAGTRFNFLTLYALYDHTEILNGCNCCEADGWSTNYHLDPNKLSVPNYIREYGAKFDLIPGKLLGTLAYFKQTRGSASTNWTTGAVTIGETLYQGYEASLTYAPRPNVSLGVNYSYIQAGGSGSNPWKNFKSSQLAGTPLNSYNFWGSYLFTQNIGAKFAFWITSKWKVNSSVTVPEQCNLDLGLFFTHPKWRVDLDIMNVTDEKNWGPSNANAGDNYGYLLPLERFGVSLRVARHF